jgi:hypothetical protein
MKKVSQILIVMAIMSLMSCGQLHVVTLYVDTSQIEQSNTDQYVHFGQPDGISNKDFTTHVRRGDKIIWEAVSISESKEPVKIDSIYHISGEEIFRRKSSGVTIPWLTTNSSLPEANGIPRVLFAGTIKKRPSEQRAFLWEKYGIAFTIDEVSYNIDPMIKAYR